VVGGVLGWLALSRLALRASGRVIFRLSLFSRINSGWYGNEFKAIRACTKQRMKTAFIGTSQRKIAGIGCKLDDEVLDQLSDAALELV
jgi:hypothetical protein